MMMRRTQIYLQESLYRKLRAKAKAANLTISEVIRRSLESDLKRSPVDDVREYFAGFKPLESFAQVDPVAYARDLRASSRILRDVDPSGAA